ncbi:MAG: acyltransferase domain-containing protein, partial [Chloroflexota bacterium]|nr:acyltransferase domain-containing protein [Chloroflexota bacterium]
SWTASVGRSHFEYRSGVVFNDAGSLRQQLDALAGGASEVGSGTAARVAFVYTGQGSQWVGMGRTLYEREPVARAVMDRCEAVFQDVRGTSLLDVMFGRDGLKGDLGDTAWEQPALYALECALTALWSSVGIRPDAVLGHSVGELAAAQASGVFSLEDGMRLAAARGSLLSGTAQGAMAAVFAPAAQVVPAVEAFNESARVGLSIAADNGAHTVVSGTAEEVEAIVQGLESTGTRARRLNTTRAFHSALLDPALDELEAFLGAVKVNHPALPFISNLTGSAVEGDMALDGTYWRRHAREPVSFASGVGALAALGIDVVVEIGPHAVLGPMAALAWPVAGSSRSPAVLASLTRPPSDGSSSEPESDFVHAVAQAYEAGLQVSFEGLFAGESRRRISMPGYPFQRERYWVEETRQRRASVGHPLLGERHESARGEITFESELFPSDPSWLADHRVFGRLVAPGALYGALAVSASIAEGSGPTVVQEMQLHNPLIFSDGDSAGAVNEEGRKVQVVLDGSDQTASHRFQIYSRGAGGEWTQHAEGYVPLGAPLPEMAGRTDLDGLRSRLSPADVPEYYRAKSTTGIDLGPSFQTLGMVWAGPGEALGEVRLPDALGRNQLDVHPLLLDGCFQVVGLARNMTGEPGEATYLPFGWQSLWLAGRLPDRLFCHVTMREASPAADSVSGEPPETLSGELRIYDPTGLLLGAISGYTVKRATPSALLSAMEGIDDLLYEVIWRDNPLQTGIEAADFFRAPADILAGSPLFSSYLSDAGVAPQGRNALLADLERWSWVRALTTLEELGWRRAVGDVVDAEDLREQLNVLPEHTRLFRRMLEMAARAGALEERDGAFVVTVGEGEELPGDLPRDLAEFSARMQELYPHGLVEIGLFQRSGLALADVLTGQADPLTLLFSSGEPTAADLYLKAPVARAANRMIADAVQALVAALPEGRRLRVIEVGAGTGSATASVLPELPEGRFDYLYTDISAGFFAEAEARFGDGGGGIEYLQLDIEKDPIAQGFDSHGYDLLIASNVLHATRRLDETLGHCKALLAPSGHLVALENLRGLGWMDLTFGQLDGWWR